MDNSRSPQKTPRLRSNRRTDGGTNHLSKVSDASGDKSETLHKKGRGSKQKQGSKDNRKVSPKGAPFKPSRLGFLEEELVAQVKIVGTPFKHLTAQSNPDTAVITGFPAAQFWFETYRTVRKEAINQVIRLTQDVLVGTVVLSSQSSEAAARQECYWLLEKHVEPYIVGFMPQTLGLEIEVISPLSDVDTAFSQMEDSGLFTLTTMWEFQWIVSKGAKP